MKKYLLSSMAGDSFVFQKFLYIFGITIFKRILALEAYFGQTN